MDSEKEERLKEVYFETLKTMQLTFGTDKPIEESFESTRDFVAELAQAIQDEFALGKTAIHKMLGDIISINLDIFQSIREIMESTKEEIKQETEEEQDEVIEEIKEEENN